MYCCSVIDSTNDFFLAPIMAWFPCGYFSCFYAHSGAASSIWSVGENISKSCASRHVACLSGSMLEIEPAAIYAYE